MNVQIVDTDAQNKKIKIGLDKSQVLWYNNNRIEEGRNKNERV